MTAHRQGDWSSTAGEKMHEIRDHVTNEIPTNGWLRHDTDRKRRIMPDDGMHFDSNEQTKLKQS